MYIASENYLNQCYGDDYLYLMFRDRKCLYCYFEVSDELIALVCRHFGGTRRDYPFHLRIMDSNEGQVLTEQTIDSIVNNWFFGVVCQPGLRYHAELGVLIGGIFFPLLKSNYLDLPLLVLSETPSATRAYPTVEGDKTSDRSVIQPISSSEFINLSSGKEPTNGSGIS